VFVLVVYHDCEDIPLHANKHEHISVADVAKKLGSNSCIVLACVSLSKFGVLVVLGLRLNL
jgi:hypothetical protein